LYLTGRIVSFDTGSGAQSTYLVPQPSGCSGSRNPEGIREDSSGFIWVADEATACPRLWKFSTGFFTWTEYTVLTGYRPWFVSIDDTAGKIWITSNDTPNNQGSFLSFVISSGVFTQVGLPTGQTKPYYLAVDHADNRVYVTFSTGYVNEYFFGSGPIWLCPSGDNYGSSSQPWGVSYVAPNSYWAGLLANNQLVTGLC
jgi:streptogramin lyase